MDTRTEEIFVVSWVSEDVILGMPFFTAHSCSLDFARPVLLVDGKELTRTDQHGRMLNFCPLCLVEGHPEKLPVATSLNQLQNNGQMIAQYLSPTEQPLIFRAGTTIGTFTAVGDEQVPDPCQGPTDSVSRIGRDIREGTVLEYLQPLVQTAKGGCQGFRETQMLANLLTRHGSVFDTGESDVVKTTLVELSIPLTERARSA